MSKELSKYLEKFRAHLKDREEYWALLRQIRRAGGRELDVLESVAVSSDEEIKSRTDVFLKLVKSGDFKEAMAIVEPSLAVIDKIDTPVGQKLKEASKKVLESELTLWHEHKLLLDWLLADQSRGLELDESEEFRELLTNRVAFSLHEELCFAEIWTEVFPEQAA